MAVVVERRKKVVVRKLPQFLTANEFKDMISPIPPHDYFRFCAYDAFFDGCELCRAYINFRDSESAKQFIERFNDYVFIDSQGNQSNAEVSFAINQDTPKAVKARRDPTANTIEEDKLYKKFSECQKERPKTSDDGDAEKPPWEVILEEIEKLEANPIPESETNLLRALTNKLERRKAKAAGRRSIKVNKITKKTRQRHPHRVSSPKEESDSTSQSKEAIAPSSRPPKEVKEKAPLSRRPPRPNRQLNPPPKNRPETPHSEEQRCEMPESEGPTVKQPPPPHSRDQPRNNNNRRGGSRGKHPPSYSALHAKSVSSTSAAPGVVCDQRPKSDGPLPYNSSKVEDDFDLPRRLRSGGGSSEHGGGRGGSRRGGGGGGGYNGPIRGRGSFSRSRGRGGASRGGVSSGPPYY